MQIVFPNPKHLPPCPAQNPVHPLVADFIPGDFFAPEGSVALGLGAVLRTAMPETTVHEKREPLPG
jgi:hypothetical protein